RGDFEPPPISAFGLEQFEKLFVDEPSDVVFAAPFPARAELAELLDDFAVFEVGADDLVIVTAALEDAPVHDVIGRSAEGIADVGLLEDALVASAGAAVGQEFLASKSGAAGAVDQLDQALADGVRHRDAEVMGPRG